MGDRRVLLGTSAVLVGLGSALISGTAVAAADTGEADSKPTDTSASGAEASAPAASPRRAGTRTRSSAALAPTATGSDPAPTSARAGRPGNRPVRVPETAAGVASAADSRPVATPSAVPVAVPDQTAAEPSAIPDAEAAPAPATPTVVEVSAAPAPLAYAAPTPAPAPAATLLSAVLTGLGWQPAGGLAVAAPALAAFTGQRQSAAPAAVVGAPVVAAAPPDPNLVGLAAAALLPAQPTNGVTGVQIGHSRLAVPGAFLGNTVAADWYFPTQVDGSVDAQGVIWLQHGFGATNTFYSALATDLAQRTNSIVVAPTLSSIPFTFSGGCLTCATTEEAAAAAFLDPNRTALIDSAVAAGYTGDTDELKGRFVLAGHSAGGGFATAVASDYIGEGSDLQDANLLGVVMFDGVSNGAYDGDFAAEVAALDAADKPIYQIAAPAQSWNAFGATTNVLAATRTGDFVGVVLQGGSHVDSMLGVNPLFDVVLQLVTQRVPAGNTAAVYTLSNGWINDMYAGATPTDPQFGLYAASNQQIVMGPALAYGLPSVVANQMGLIDSLVYGVIGAVGGIFGLQLPAQVNTGFNGLDPADPVTLVGSGVTGVRVGSAVLEIPCGDDNFYAAPADWYFPTQANGEIQANGVLWLQHGFLGTKGWYADMAQALAQETNSIVVVPNIFWFDTPLCPGCYLGGEKIQEGAATMFLGGRSQLNNSARATGIFQGTLPEDFVLTGHSAGGNFATAVGGYTVDNGAASNLLGVVMFDGVSRAPLFTSSLAKLDSLGIPDYQIAAPPQRWNAWGITTELISVLHPDQFTGTQIDDGSHTDVIGGDSLWGLLGELGSDLIVKPSPPGAKLAVRTFATGWVNDLYSGNGPTDPLYGIYGNPNDGTYVGNQPIVMGQAGATTLPAPPPVDVNQYAGKWYEQGSVKQFFSFGLVNITATYTPQLDGSIKVENAGNYFGPNGPSSTITGSAVAVNEANTRLSVGFFFGEPSSDEPGNYWILDYAPDYSWAIVGDPNGTSGYILTRDQFIAEDEYDALVDRAYQLGVRRTISPTAQFPTSSPTAALPGPATLPASVTV